MSRSGYVEDGEDMWAHICYRGAVKSSLRGQRGQQFLRELAAAMDAMPVKELIADELQADGAFCTIGVLGAARGIDMTKLDPTDAEAVGKAFGIAESMAREIVYENDETMDTHYWMRVEVCGPMPSLGRTRYAPQEHITDVRVEKPDMAVRERRWKRMRKWVADNLHAPAKEGA